jgi:hypothetical protein
MKEEFLKRPRMSRIYWTGKFLDYPLDGHGRHQEARPVELTRSLFSYLWAAVTPKGNEDDLESWVSNRFGKRLYQLFFKSYTEKVWGVPCTELRAEWAAQRIKGLSFFSAAKAAFFGNRGNKIKSLISSSTTRASGRGRCGRRWPTRSSPRWRGAPQQPRDVARGRDGRVVAVVAGGERIECSEVISSLRCGSPSASPSPSPPPPCRRPPQGLRYRDFLTVALVIDGEDLFPDNWIYIHEPGVRSAASRTSAPGARGWSRTSPRPRRPGVLLLPGRRPVGVADDGSSSSPSARSSSSASRPAEGRARLRDARPEGLPDVRRRLRRARGVIRELARGHLEPPAGRPQRPAPVQHLRSLSASQAIPRRRPTSFNAAGHDSREVNARVGLPQEQRRAVQHRTTGARDEGDGGAAVAQR